MTPPNEPAAATEVDFLGGYIDDGGFVVYGAPPRVSPSSGSLSRGLSLSPPHPHAILSGEAALAAAAAKVGAAPDVALLQAELSDAHERLSEARAAWSEEVDVLSAANQVRSRVLYIVPGMVQGRSHVVSVAASAFRLRLTHLRLNSSATSRTVHLCRTSMRTTPS
jgi:hypothetical protein